jgi:hypothetical protein
MIRLPPTKIELTGNDVQFHLQNVELNVVLRQAGYTWKAIDDFHKSRVEIGNEDRPEKLDPGNSYFKVPSTSSTLTSGNLGDLDGGNRLVSRDSGAWDDFVVQRLRRLGIDEMLRKGPQGRSIVFVDDVNTTKNAEGRGIVVGQVRSEAHRQRGRGNVPNDQLADVHGSSDTESRYYDSSELQPRGLNSYSPCGGPDTSWRQERLSITSITFNTSEAAETSIGVREDLGGNKVLPDARGIDGSQDVDQREERSGGLTGHRHVPVMGSSPAWSEPQPNPNQNDSPGASHVPLHNFRRSNTRQSSLLRFSVTPSTIPSDPDFSALPPSDQQAVNKEESSLLSTIRSHNRTRSGSDSDTRSQPGGPQLSALPRLRRVSSTSSLHFQSSPLLSPFLPPPFSSTPRSFTPTTSSGVLPLSTHSSFGTLGNSSSLPDTRQ